MFCGYQVHLSFSWSADVEHWATVHKPRIDSDDKVQCGSKADACRGEKKANAAFNDSNMTERYETQIWSHIKIKTIFSLFISSQMHQFTCEEGESCEDGQSLLLCLRVVWRHGEPEHHSQRAEHRQHAALRTTTRSTQGSRVVKILNTQLLCWIMQRPNPGHRIIVFFCQRVHVHFQIFISCKTVV